MLQNLRKGLENNLMGIYSQATGKLAELFSASIKRLWKLHGLTAKGVVRASPRSCSVGS